MDKQINISIDSELYKAFGMYCLKHDLTKKKALTKFIQNGIIGADR